MNINRETHRDKKVFCDVCDRSKVFINETKVEPQFVLTEGNL